MRSSIFSRNSLLEVPPDSRHNSGMLDEIKIGDVVSDGFEDGMVHSIRKDGGDIWFEVYDGKEGWSMHYREVKLVNGKEW